MCLRHTTLVKSVIRYITSGEQYIGVCRLDIYITTQLAERNVSQLIGYAINLQDTILLPNIWTPFSEISDFKNQKMSTI